MATTDFDDWGRLVSTTITLNLGITDVFWNVAPTNPSGVIQRWTVPAAETWQVLGVFFLYTCDATAGNRRMRLTCYDATPTSLLAFMTAQNFIASSVARMSYQSDFEGETAVNPSGANWWVTELMPRLVLLTGYRLEIDALNAQATDAITLPAIMYRKA